MYRDWNSYLPRFSVFSLSLRPACSAGMGAVGRLPEELRHRHGQHAGAAADRSGDRLRVAGRPAGHARLLHIPRRHVQVNDRQLCLEYRELQILIVNCA